MALLNISEFARFAKVSRMAVYKAIERGRLRINKQKKIDTKFSLNAEFITAHNGGRPRSDPKPAKTKREPTAKKKTATKKTASRKKTDSKRKDKRANGTKPIKPKARPVVPKPKPAAPRVIPTPKVDSEYQPSIDFSDADGETTRSDAELEKTIGQVRQLHIRNDRERQELIDRELVRTILAQLSQIDTTEFLTLGSNIAPELAGICGEEKPATILKMAELIQKKCYRVLKHRTRKINDFLKRIKADKLDESTE